MGGTHARRAALPNLSVPFGDELDFRPLLASLAADRLRGRDVSECARAFQRGIARGLCNFVVTLCESHALDTVVLSGGVFQNQLLLADMKSMLAATHSKSGPTAKSLPTTAASAWAKPPWHFAAEAH